MFRVRSSARVHVLADFHDHGVVDMVDPRIMTMSAEISAESALDESLDLRVCEVCVHSRNRIFATKAVSH